MAQTERNAATSENSMQIDRRRFLGTTGLAAFGATLGMSGGGADIPAAYAQGAAPAAAAPKGPQYLKFPGKNEKLVLLGDKPLVAETPESLLDDDTTPTAKFFIRNNANTPDPVKDSDSWKLTIDGEVNNKV